LREKLLLASQKISEFEKSTGNAWEDVKLTADKIWDDIKLGVASVHAKFK